VGKIINLKHVLISIVIIFGANMTIMTMLIQKNNTAEAISFSNNLNENSISRIELYDAHLILLKKIESKSIISSLIKVIKKSKEDVNQKNTYFAKYYLTLYANGTQIDLKILYSSDDIDCNEIVYFIRTKMSAPFRSCDFNVWLCTTLRLNCANSK